MVILRATSILGRQKEDKEMMCTSTLLDVAVKITIGIRQGRREGGLAGAMVPPKFPKKKNFKGGKKK
jgi:hypothetical protein